MLTHGIITLESVVISMVTIIYHGFCPQNRIHKSIEIELVEVMIGSLVNDYKKMSFECADVDECEHLDEYGRCPLFIEAPDHP